MSLFDKIITNIDRGLSSMVNDRLSLKLMRINHTGEVCAQALYHGQALTAKSKELEKTLLEAAAEEQEHLNLCHERITQLGGKTSKLNPVFAAGAFGIGVVAGLASDKISLGFIAETEHQVSDHLAKHLQKLPKDDHLSRQILLKMKEDEERHATNALAAGGVALPLWIRKLMKTAAKVMTSTAGYI